MTSSPRGLGPIHPQSAGLVQIASPEHVLHTITQIAAKWRKHVQAAVDPRKTRGMCEEQTKHIVMAAAYCQSLAILLDQPYNVVRESLEAGAL